MIPPLIHYSTLAQALKSCTAVKNPDQIATKVLCNLTSRFPDATHVVLCVTTDSGSSQFGAWHAIAIGPSNRFKIVQEAEGVHINDAPQCARIRLPMRK